MFAFILLSIAFFALHVGAITVLPLTRVSKSSVGQLSLSNQATPVNVTDVHEYAYLADIGIGSQPLPVIIDTGSYDLWVVSSNCSTSDCSAIRKYTDSPTLQNTNTTFDITYLTGFVSGTVAYESVSLGSYLVMNQVLALATDPRDVGLTSVGNSGIMGLAFPRVASIPLLMGQNFMSNVLDHLDVDSRCFGVRLGRDDQESVLTIGGASDNGTALDVKGLSLMAVYSDDEKSFDYWKLPLNAILWGPLHSPLHLSQSKLARSSHPIGVFDTGTTLILGPSGDVRDFWVNVGGARQAADGTWQVPCQLAIEMAFVFGNVTVYIDPADLSWSSQQSIDGWCDGGVQANDKVIGGDWLLGDTFLRNAYITHCVSAQDRPPRIGLLPLTDANASLDAFKTSRGSLSVTPSTSTLALPNSIPSESLWVSIVAPILGFVAGSLSVTLWKLWSNRASRRHRHERPAEMHSRWQKWAQ